MERDEQTPRPRIVPAGRQSVDRSRVFPIAAVEVHDGDTLRATLDLGFRISASVSIRISGIDTPELSDVRQAEAATVCRRAVLAWLAAGDPARMQARILREDKFGGRWLGDVVDLGRPGQTLGGYLVAAGFARRYHGEAKRPWSDAELSAVIDAGR